MKLIKYLLLFIVLVNYTYAQDSKKIVYLVSDIRIPFWNIIYKGMKNKSEQMGYEIEFYSADNIKKNELENTIKALSQDIDGLVISPINSSTAVTILDFAKNKNVPVVIADIGTEKGEYISYISSDNEDGSYKLGQVLAKKMANLQWDKEGTVGIIAIPQKRENGKARTDGFMRALKEANIKGAGIYQQVDFSYKETYEYTQKLINNNPQLRAVWLQGSDRYNAALNAINDSGKKDEILLICFDAESIFLELIPKGVLAGAAMQQPYLIGEKSVETLDAYLNGEKVIKHQKLEIFAVSTENIEEKLPIIKKNVLGIE